MADRKQGAGLSSGSSVAVHKANYDFSFYFHCTFQLEIDLYTVVNI